MESPRRRRTVPCLAWGLALLAASCGEAGSDAGTGAGTGTRAEPARVAELGAPGRAAGYDLLLVTLDTVRADRLGCYGYEQAATPTIDALAAKGVRFTDVTAPAPVTLPSHVTLMTGLDVPSHGVRNNSSFRLGREHETLAERLADAGYESGAFVGAFVLDGRYGLDQGFGTYDDDTNPGGAATASGHFHERDARRVVDATLSWWAEQPADARLFTWVHTFDAHAPYEPPPEAARLHPGRPYDGELTHVDTQLGRLVEQLRASGRLERTLVVVTADHGEGLGEHGEPSHSVLVYESTMHVPLILSNPTLFDEPWVVDDRVGGLVDLAPTLLSLLGLPALDATDGRDLFEATPDPDRALYIESMVPLLTYGWAPLTGLRRHRDKYIHGPAPEYYRLDERPREGDDRLADGGGDPEAARLADALAARVARWGEGEVTEPPLDPETAETLAALGYVRSGYRAPGERANPRDMIAVWGQIQQAEMASQRGDHAGARATLERVLRDDPTDGRAWHHLALVHLRTRRFDAAEEALERAASHAPAAEVYVQLAQLQARRSDDAAFETTAAKVRALDPGNGEIEIAAGDRLAVQGRFFEALAAFEKALAVDPVRVGALAEQKIAAVKERLDLR